MSAQAAAAQEALRRRLAPARSAALAVGAAGLLAVCLAAALGAERVYRSYLIGFLFWTGAGFGCFAVLMLHHLVGGRWGFAIRRILEAGTRTFPVMALLFVPLLFGLAQLYPWARPGAAGEDSLLAHKSPYLNVSFFVVRTGLYFALWTVMAVALNRWSTIQDRTGDPALTRKLQLLSGPGLVLYGITAHFASVDWVMSIEPHWYSTIFGMLFMVGQGLSAIAIAVAVLVAVHRQPPLQGRIEPVVFKDLGNLLLTFVMLWAYMSFCQFLIIWAGNLKEEVPWYLHRMEGGWRWLALVLIVLHFFVPFFLLLSRETKRRTPVLAAVALGLLVMRLVDLFWITVPTSQGGSGVGWTDFAAPLGIGGVWVWVFLGQVAARPLVPLHDPRLEAAEAELEASHG